MLVWPLYNDTFDTVAEQSTAAPRVAGSIPAQIINICMTNR